MPCYKLYYNQNNILKKVYVFINHILVANDIDIEDFKKLYQINSKDNLFNELFSDDEKKD